LTGGILVPVKIRKHLIPFFYKEFAGIEAYYLGKQVKACKINMASSLGFMLRTTLEKAELPAKGDKFYLYFSMFDEEKDSKLYNCVSGKKNWLKVPDKVNDKINDILEDQFRIAFVYFVEGLLRANKFLEGADNEIRVRQAIEEFMLDYELDESGFELESMRRLLDRTKESNHKMSRMQVKTTNRVKNRKL
jgi:hypothetical protein